MGYCSSGLLVCLAKLGSLADVRPILELAIKTAKPLLLVAGDVEGEALSTVLVNVERGVLRCVAIKVPGRSEQPFGVLKDLAILTGATIVDPSLGPRLADLREDHLGHADRVVVGVDQTEILGGRGDPKAIGARVDALKNAASQAVEHDRWVLAERVARLAGAIVTVRVGGSTADDIREKLYRARSAQSAFAAAVASGCVPGGGAALLFASAALDDLETRDNARHAGIEVVKNALEAPLRTLIPSGVNAGEIVAEAKAGGPHFGYNVKTRRVEDLVAAGIVDPLEVVTRAVEIAHSTARGFLETGAWHVASPER